MKILNSLAIAFLLVMFQVPATATAGPDQYIGDTAIYSGASTNLRPNVLLIIDNSNATLNSASGSPYDPNTTYTGTYSSWAIYEADQQGDFTKIVVTSASNALENLACTNNSNIVKNTLLSAGTYVGSGTTNNPNLKGGTGASAGKAVCDTAPKGATYAIGNFLNYTESVTGGSYTQQQAIYKAIDTVLSGARYAVNFGAMVYGSNNKGGNVVFQISDLSVDADFNSFLSVLPGGTPGTAVLSSQTARPQAEALLDAGYYFKGEGLPISGQAAMTSPITRTCDKNYIILITNGLSNKDDDPQLATLVGDQDGDKAEEAPYGSGTHYLDDVAQLLYESDASSSLSTIQRVITHTVLAFQASDPLVERAGEKYGKYYNATSPEQLAAALTKLISNIVKESDTSFVAPVVPVSPENRTYSGSRVYMGFFKPITQKYWNGNLKKYGLNNDLRITDKNGNLATYMDINADGKDDKTGETLPLGASNGSFRSSSVSYWSSASDGGSVENGGAGGALLTRSSARNIYTYTGSNTALTHASNQFTTTNTAITNVTVDLSDAAEKDQLVNFIHGNDPLDEDADTNTTEKRNWILGDILHSKPLVINYASYTFTSANESDCSVNKTMIYVGANDGMLHAFKDCDGSEAWAFIPPDMLQYLKNLMDTSHSYFVDASPSVYIYDADKDGNIESGDGDKVIMIFGERRGGGVDTAPTTGKYYALDVTDPAAPVYLWSKGNTDADYSEMAETWSEVRLGKIKIGTSAKIVAFIGAGYDNANEDGRYGSTLTFPGTGTVTSTATGYGNVTTSGSASALNPKGRGIFVVEIATLNNGVPDFTNSGAKVWGYTYGAAAGTGSNYVTDPNMTFSIPSDVSAIDTDGNAFVDRLYVGDTGGNLWRFDVGSTAVSGWTGKKIFNLNTGSSTSASMGKKIFYRPVVTLEYGYATIFVGTGDREHPLNWGNYADRLYALKDRGQSVAKTEADLVDVTTNVLQQTSDATNITSTLTNLDSASKYGWFIRLTEFNTSTGATTSGNSGEKSLSSPFLYNKVVYFTTFEPNTTGTPDPCTPGNLGTGKLYALDYKTGEAAINLYLANDSNYGSLKDVNARSTAIDGKVLTRVDRSVDLGAGIPSGLVLMVNEEGKQEGIVSTGGDMKPVETKKGSLIKQLLWRQK